MLKCLYILNQLQRYYIFCSFQYYSLLNLQRSMKRSNEFGFGHSAQSILNAEAGAPAACGTACGGGDKEEKPAACGSACGSGDKEEKPAACGSACGTGDK
jgi:ACGX-repeat protein